MQALLRWADRATAGSAGKFKLVGKRAAAIAYTNANGIAIAIANAYTIAIANANAIANAIANGNVIANANAYTIANAIAYGNANANGIDSARELEKLEIFNNVNFNVLIAQLEALKAEVPDRKQSLKVRRKFVERLQQTWLNAFNLSPEMVNLSEEEAKALENYLYANYLIIQCKEAAVQVSSKTWKAIEERMLLVPGD